MVSRRALLASAPLLAAAAACSPVTLARRLLMGAGGSGAFPTPALTAFAVSSAPNGGWCWFQDARAYSRGGKTYLGWLDGSNGRVRAAQWDEAGRTLSTPAGLYTSDAFFETDDHDAPALLRRSSDGRILAGYTIHVGDIYTALSASPDDATAFGSIANITASIGARSGSAGYTYAHLIELSDGIHYTYRHHDSGGTARIGSSTSADNGATWPAGTDVCTVTYHKAAQNGTGRIDFAASEHPNEALGHDILHFYQQGGSFYRTDGTLISGSLPFAKSAATKVYDGSTTMGWIWDVAVEPGTGYPVIVYATFPGATLNTDDGTATDHRYNYARWDGAAWTSHEVCAAGGTIVTADYPPGNRESFYSGGVVLDHSDPSIVYASRFAGSAGRWDVWRYSTPDHGATWSSYALTSSGKNVRPVPVLGHGSGPQVLWLTGTYDDYVSYSQGISGAGS